MALSEDSRDEPIAIDRPAARPFLGKMLERAFARIRVAQGVIRWRDAGRQFERAFRRQVAS